MHTIYHNLLINVVPEEVFPIFATPTGLEKWWTKNSQGLATVDYYWQFYFEEAYDWGGILNKIEKNKIVQWSVINADEDWTGTQIQIELKDLKGKTEVCFAHSGWKEQNDNFKISSYCWAQYLRLAKLYLEEGYFLEYEKRLFL